MSDAFYFACLGVEVVAAIAMPIAATEFAKACSHVGLRAGSIAALAALGIGASLPFARTSE
ncbi:MAG: hypothetical protein NTW19_11510, partial [Planctomycetota bacterium]|nr:hypothetical protein [Planctomycetota bacterium]